MIGTQILEEEMISVCLSGHDFTINLHEIHLDNVLDPCKIPDGQTLEKPEEVETFCDSLNEDQLGFHH